MTAKEKLEVVAICDHLAGLKFSKVNPNAFTEHGALMAASVLNSSRAIEMSIFVIRAFTRLRDLVARHAELAEKFDRLEGRLADHDDRILGLVTAIRRLATSGHPSPKRRIGFETDRNA